MVNLQDLYHIVLRDIAISSGPSVPASTGPIESRLPPELWTIILQNLQRDDPKALGAAGLSCRGLRRLVLPLQMRSVILNYFGAKDAVIIEGLHNTHAAHQTQCIVKSGSEIIEHPRILFIRRFRPDNRAEAKDVLQEVVKRAQNLRVLKTGIWSVANSLIKSLDEHRRHARLVIESEYLPTNISELTGLANSSCLSSLSCASPFTEHGSETLISAYALLMHIICTSANLKILRLELYSADRFPDRWPRLSPRSGDRFPNIKHLHLSGHFAVEPPKSSYWADAIQWESLKSLTLGNEAIVPFLQLATGRISHLDSFGLFWDSWHASEYFDPVKDLILDFVKSLSELPSFSTSNISKQLLFQICEHHGKHLRSLAVHRVVDGRNDYWTTGTFGYHFNDTLPLLFWQSIYGIPPLLQDLENFEVTAVWNGQWPEQMIIAVSKFPRLKTLTVSIPMTLSGMHLSGVHVEANAPYIKEEMCRNLYAKLSDERERQFPSYQSRVSSGELEYLSALDVKVGEWDIICKPQPRWPENADRRLYACRTTTSRHASPSETIKRLSINKIREPYGPCHRFNLHRIALGKLGLESEVEAWC